MTSQKTNKQMAPIQPNYWAECPAANVRCAARLPPGGLHLTVTLLLPQTDSSSEFQKWSL